MNTGAQLQYFPPMAMEIKELVLPPHLKSITYTITSNSDVEQKKHSLNKEKMLQNLTLRCENAKIQLGAVNSIQMTRDHKWKNMLNNCPFVLIAPQGGGEEKSTLKCKCRSSKCLKLYCQCFSKGSYCSAACECTSCANTEVNSKRLQALREESSSKRLVEASGCKCKKSGCKKKYCECFSKSIPCGANCQCLDCQNKDCFHIIEPIQPKPIL